MEVRHARYFVAIAEAGTVSAAAMQVHVTQPALSRQIRQFEDELGVLLFDRVGGRLVLNRVGRQLLPRARELVMLAEALTADARFHADGGVREVTIAAPTVTLTDVVSPFVASMSPDDPVVVVQTADGHPAASMLERGADLAIDTRRAAAPYESRALVTLPVWAYVPRDHEWSSRTEVDLAELTNGPVIGVPASFTAREALDAAVATNGGVMSNFLEAANGTIAQALAASGRGVAVVSDDPRFDLVPLAIHAGGEVVAIRLVTVWDPRSMAGDYLADLARRLATWVNRQYPSAVTVGR